MDEFQRDVEAVQGFLNATISQFNEKYAGKVCEALNHKEIRYGKISSFAIEKGRLKAKIHWKRKRPTELRGEYLAVDHPDCNKPWPLSLVKLADGK